MKLFHLKANILFMILLFAGMTLAANITEKNGKYYFSDRLIIKLKAAQGDFVQMPGFLAEKGERYSFYQVEKSFYHKSKSTRSSSELDKYITVYFSAPYDAEFLASKLKSNPEIEWAGPWYLDEIFFTPNDPEFSTQYSLAITEAEAAWEISTSSSDVVIAINDTGVDWDHPDLAANIWENSAEANGSPGIDDDNNGYIDDIRGWDFGGLTGTPDNDPMEDQPDHGSLVAGIASAVTNNGVGVASIGFSCTIMPVKTSQDDIRSNTGVALISHGYQGIIYAADNGADVINLSWGGAPFSMANKDIVDYAIEQGALIVASSGNSNSTEEFYPADYFGVLSIGASNQTDNRWSASNYGTWLDVVAPGSMIYSTWQDDDYTTANGTSMAAPFVAGLAGLAMSEHTSYNALQIAELIRVNCDNIDGQNPGYEYMLGSGRVNAAKTLGKTVSKSVRYIDAEFIDMGDGDGILEPGEQVEIALDMFNYLDAVSALNVEITTSSGAVTLQNSSWSAGAVNANSAFDNGGNHFTFQVASGAATNTEVDLRLTYTDGSYSSFQWLTVMINPSYATLSGNNIRVTVTSKGNIGFNDYYNNTQGEGFKYMDGPNLLYEGGFMYGTGADKLVNCVRGQNTDFADDDFNTIRQFTLSAPGSVADEQGFAIFNDENAGGAKLGIRTDLHTFSFGGDEDNNYVVMKYILYNASDNPINGLYAGLYFDWDIEEADYEANSVGYDNTNNFGYAFNTDNSPDSTYIATALISSTDYGFYGLDNAGTPFEIYDDFTDQEKWTMLSSGVTSTSISDADISVAVSGGPYNIPAGDYVDVAFVVAAAYNLPDVSDAVAAARNKYSSLVTGIEETGDGIIPAEYSLSQNYPNPFNPETTIRFSVIEETEVSLKVFDILGREVANLVENNMQPGKYSVKFNGENLSSGIYFYRIEAGSFSAIRKMMILK